MEDGIFDGDFHPFAKADLPKLVHTHDRFMLTIPGMKEALCPLYPV